MLTDLQLAQIMRHASTRRRAQCLDPLNRAMQAHRIDANLQRVAAFLAQLGHESGELQFLEELWGPTPAQKRYEPPGELARRLGNTQRGDGRRFKGRGPIQITGRANYARYGELLGVGLVGQPQQAVPPFPEWEDVSFRKVYCGPYTLRAAGPRVILGVLTGNFAETGRLKLRHCGIDPDAFQLHVWGDESPHPRPSRGRARPRRRAGRRLDRRARGSRAARRRQEPLRRQGRDQGGRCR